MALQNLVGQGFWMPSMYGWETTSQSLTSSDTALLDADEEEFQVIGQVHIDGGGSKTFGTSGSKIGWLPGASIAFIATANLRVGVKQAASVDTANGPPARATIGAAAFDVYKDLVGGTDTITSTTWRDDAMAAGTPFTVTDGDFIAVCFHLDITSGTQSIKVRGFGATGPGFPVPTLVTSGPTYTLQNVAPNIILTFDDTTLGWIDQTVPFLVSDTPSASIGSGNIFGNIFRFPFSCKIDAIAASCTIGAGADCALELYSTPLGTPGLIESLAIDANTVSTAAIRPYFKKLLTPRTLSINTDYLAGVKQAGATNLTVNQRDQNVAAYNKPSGMGAECYAATSTAGATFAAINSGKRRYHIWVRVSALDDGASPLGHGNFPGMGIQRASSY